MRGLLLREYGWCRWMNEYVAIAMLSGLLSAFAQVLLKKSSGLIYKSRLKEYVNIYVISGYGITFLCMIMMIIAFKGLPLKYGAALESLIYVYIMVLGRFFLNENLTVKRVLGNLMIVCGVCIYSLG